MTKSAKQGLIALIVILAVGFGLGIWGGKLIFKTEQDVPVRIASQEQWVEVLRWYAAPAPGVMIDSHLDYEIHRWDSPELGALMGVTTIVYREEKTDKTKTERYLGKEVVDNDADSVVQPSP